MNNKRSTPPHCMAPKALIRRTARWTRRRPQAAFRVPMSPSTCLRCAVSAAYRTRPSSAATTSLKTPSVPIRTSFLAVSLPKTDTCSFFSETDDEDLANSLNNKFRLFDGAVVGTGLRHISHRRTRERRLRHRSARRARTHTFRQAFGVAVLRIFANAAHPAQTASFGCGRGIFREDDARAQRDGLLH